MVSTSRLAGRRAASSPVNAYELMIPVCRGHMRLYLDN
jgi:hypothetical protein